ncbi:pantetheine-phosphate adenylyltransferase [Eubacteriales bacterium OttesenSCG-928-M02]|nr:pantetheine-phosphate adenylyltransferase [Eubacteriales bacterium OttesenSCG-928-M02]
MKIAIYPGSFDPITNGHMDVIERAANVFDRLVVGVLVNKAKTFSFTMEERVEQIKKSTGHLENVLVEGFDGLTVAFAQRHGASAIVRGLRALSDFENEMAIAAINRRLKPELDTVAFFTSAQWSFISSSMVKEMCGYGEDIKGLVPEAILWEVEKKLRNQGGSE